MEKFIGKDINLDAVDKYLSSFEKATAKQIRFFVKNYFLSDKFSTDFSQFFQAFDSSTHLAEDLFDLEKARRGDQGHGNNNEFREDIMSSIRNIFKESKGSQDYLILKLSNLFIEKYSTLRKENRIELVSDGSRLIRFGVLTVGKVNRSGVLNIHLSPYCLQKEQISFMKSFEMLALRICGYKFSKENGFIIDSSKDEMDIDRALVISGHSWIITRSSEMLGFKLEGEPDVNDLSFAFSGQFIDIKGDFNDKKDEDVVFPSTGTIGVVDFLNKYLPEDFKNMILSGEVVIKLKRKDLSRTSEIAEVNELLLAVNKIKTNLHSFNSDEEAGDYVKNNFKFEDFQRIYNLAGYYDFKNCKKYYNEFLRIFVKYRKNIIHSNLLNRYIQDDDVGDLDHINNIFYIIEKGDMFLEEYDLREVLSVNNENKKQG